MRKIVWHHLTFPPMHTGVPCPRSIWTSGSSGTDDNKTTASTRTIHAIMAATCPPWDCPTKMTCPCIAKQRGRIKPHKLAYLLPVLPGYGDGIKHIAIPLLQPRLPANN